MNNLNRSMLVGGVFSSEAVDSSGEILSIEGCDITELVRTGVANWEHKQGKALTDKDGKEIKGNNGEEIVGKIVFAKKIFGPEDCDTDDQRKYWNEVKLP